MYIYILPQGICTQHINIYNIATERYTGENSRGNALWEIALIISLFA